jgi:Leucine-rich repeat (LRR) protein
MKITNLSDVTGNFRIDLSHHGLNDIKHLASLDPKTRSDLLSLNLSHNSLQSVAVLQGFPNLWVLNVSCNTGLTDLSGLEAMKVLGQLTINQNQAVSGVLAKLYVISLIVLDTDLTFD